MSLNIGIIGYGKMGKTRHYSFKDSGKGKLIAISEPNFGELINNVPNISHNDIISHSDIDAIFICTPNFLNKELTIRALKANKHVFCEKPPAFTADDIREIQKVEAESGCKLMFGFNHRHHDSIIRIKSILDSNEYGSILWMRGRYGKSVTEDYTNQ